MCTLAGCRYKRDETVVHSSADKWKHSNYTITCNRDQYPYWKCDYQSGDYEDYDMQVNTSLSSVNNGRVGGTYRLFLQGSR
jgi:hypothetical protein